MTAATYLIDHISLYVYKSVIFLSYTFFFILLIPSHLCNNNIPLVTLSLHNIPLQMYIVLYIFLRVFFFLPFAQYSVIFCFNTYLVLSFFYYRFSYSQPFFFFFVEVLLLFCSFLLLS
ncbi:hypothetical protein LDENG_00286850 [Lucifuga dentata]|nr:hypothetical protein LDENG_00286850 [Lucifuga dentata]